MTDAQDRQDALAGELARLAEVAGTSVTDRLRGDIAQLSTVALRRWVQQFGGIEQTPELLEVGSFVVWFVDQLTRIMAVDALDPEPLAGAWRLAYAAGLDHAADTAWWRPETSAASRAAPSIDLSKPLAAGAVRALQGVNAATLSHRGFAVVQESVTRARSTVSRIESAVAGHVTAAASQAVRDVAAERNAHVLWVAERDGCLHCLAYAGQTTTGVFPPGLTFGDRPLPPPAVLLGPPLHPRCRCSLEVWHADDTAVVEALKREAKRSVLRGEANDDSEAVRLRAAARLLEAGAGLPKTVEDRARRAVRAGEFTR